MSDEFKHNDELLKKWLKQVHQDVDIPDGKQSWQEVKSQLNKIKRRKRWMKRIKLSTLVVCCSLIISFTMMIEFPTAYSHFSTLVKTVQNNIMTIFLEEPEQHDENHSGAITAPPPSDMTHKPSGETESEETSLEEAKRKASFPVVSPSYMPKDYEMDMIRLFQDSNGDYRTVLMAFVNGEGHLLQLNQRLVREDGSEERVTIQHNEADIKDVTINGHTAVIISTNNNLLQMEWLTSENIKFSLSGRLTEDELIKVAESLQR